MNADLSACILQYTDFSSPWVVRGQENAEISDQAGSVFQRALKLLGSHTLLSGTNLSRASMLGANVSGANLRDANLSSSKLFDANLTRAHLGSTDFTHAVLINADLTRSVLRCAKLVGADFNGANLSGTDLGGSSPDDPPNRTPTRRLDAGPARPSVRGP